MGAPSIFEQQIEIKLLHPASTLKSRIQLINDCSSLCMRDICIKILPCGLLFVGFSFVGFTKRCSIS
ncbi:MAG: hypothetical protein P8X74_21390 [Reinekea sp.]